MSCQTEFENSTSITSVDVACENCDCKNDHDELIVIFVVGGPGAGKGTQCKLISEKYGNIVTLSTGALLRNFIKSDTLEAKQIAKQMNQGILVDINATEKLLKPEFLKHEQKRIKQNRREKNIFIIDGFPRDINILNDWQNSMKDEEAFVPFIIEFICDDNILHERLLNREMKETVKRGDNNSEAIQNRINLFRNDTQEVIDYFKQLNKYQSIDATQSVDKVFKSFCQLIDPIQNYCQCSDYLQSYASNNTTKAISYCYDCEVNIEYYSNQLPFESSPSSSLLETNQTIDINNNTNCNGDSSVDLSGDEAVSVIDHDLDHMDINEFNTKPMFVIL